MATTWTQKAIIPRKTISGNPPWTEKYPEQIGQTFAAGALVALDGTGNIVEAGTNPGSILGVAAEAAHNYAALDPVNNLVAVYLADDDTIFLGNLGGTGANTFALTDLGKPYGITRQIVNGLGIWLIDKTKTGGQSPDVRRVVIVGLDLQGQPGGPPSPAVGDINVPLQFFFLQNYCNLFMTS